MPQSNKKRRRGMLSPFDKARAQANFLLSIAFSQEPPPNLRAVRIGRRTMSVDEVRTELNAVRARLDAHFAQPAAGADATRRRINEDLQMPFTVMAGERR